MKKRCLINYYGMLAEVMGVSNEVIELQWQKNQNAREIFIQHHPTLKDFPFQVAIDTKLVETIDHSDFNTISLLPPFSGG